MIAVRRASERDIGGLYEIYSHESVSPYLGFDPCSRSEFNEIFDELSKGGELLVGEDDRGIVAVCQIVRRKRRLSHSVYLGSLAVRPDEQGKGVGKEFFGDIVARLLREGFSRIELLVAADNARAIEFFEGFGFVVEGTHSDYFSRAGSDLLFSEHTMAYIKSRRPNQDEIL